jgi:hypothetical protein
MCPQLCGPTEIAQMPEQPQQTVFIGPAVLLLVKHPSCLGNVNHRPVQLAALGQPLQCRKDLFVSTIGSRTKNTSASHCVLSISPTACSSKSQIVLGNHD